VGAEFVKTSTGFGFTKRPDGSYNYHGATEHDVALMRAQCSARVQVKAAGGIRTYAQAARLRELGATRIGATATEAIAAGEKAALGK
jgi:deoxyribose-phosphate aldolase